jgi:DNA-binding IclR family transcriptional regulator
MAVAGLNSMASVRKAMMLLDVLARDAQGLTAKEIALRLDVPLPTAYRLLQTLTEAEFVVHLRSERKYALGYKLHSLDAALHRQLITPPAVKRLINQLHVDADAAAYYAVHRGEDIVIAHVADSRLRPRISPMGFGFQGCGHATAFGKIMLAGMDNQHRDSYLKRYGMMALTPLTIREKTELLRQLEQVRATGLAAERQEFVGGKSCLAAPVTNPGGQIIGSVAVSVDACEFESQYARLGKILRETAHRVSRELSSGRI